MKLRVCVIGAGAAGLAALRHLAASPETFSCIAFEQTADIGGTWVYTRNVGKDSHGLPIHSSMYKNMRTNLPKEVMAFLDFPFPSSGRSFVHHSKVLQYLQDYAQHFDLYRHIKFQHQVTSVSPKEVRGSGVLWEVTSKNLENNRSESSEFDAVFIGNGHYFETNVPKIPDLEKFRGSVIHSHSYRDPEDYSNQKVILLGASQSGQDIAVELSETASQVILSHNLPKALSSKMPPKTIQRSGIARALENGFVLKDGSRCEADALILCTGYNYSFPFLSTECGVRVQDNRVQPLYKHCVHVKFPNVFFIGLPFSVVPFPLFDMQCQFALAVLQGKTALPSEAEMLEDADSDWNHRREALNLRARQGHMLHSEQWSYVEDLARRAGVRGYPPVIRKIYNSMAKYRDGDMGGFKDYDLRVNSAEDTFVILPSNHR